MATIESLEKELFLLQQDRMRIINEDSLRFKAIEELTSTISPLVGIVKNLEANLRLFSESLLALNDRISNLKDEVKRVNDAQVLLNRQFSLKVEIKPKSKKSFKWPWK